MLKVAAATLVFSCVGIATAQTSATCASSDGRTKFTISVSRTEANISNVAVTTLDPTKITARADFYTLSHLSKQLVLSHECGHAAFQTGDEATALRYGGQLFCVIGYSLDDLKTAQSELLARSLTNSSAIRVETGGYKSKCP